MSLCLLFAHLVVRLFSLPTMNLRLLDLGSMVYKDRRRSGHQVGSFHLLRNTRHLGGRLFPGEVCLEVEVIVAVPGSGP